MNTVKTTVKDKIVYVRLDRGKSNAINAEMVVELQQVLQEMEADPAIGGMILTGKEGFFSAGLDLIELYDYDDQLMKDFWNKFLDLILSLVSFKKPLISAITGHSPGGGCILALCSDYRLMINGPGIIGLNELSVGIIVPESIFCLYAFWLGKTRAYQFLLEGKLMRAEEALQVGLVDELVSAEELYSKAEKKMKKYLQLNANVWQKTKTNFRKQLVDQLIRTQSATVNETLKQWWSPSTRAILNTIIQHLKTPKLV